MLTQQGSNQPRYCTLNDPAGCALGALCMLSPALNRPVCCQVRCSAIETTHNNCLLGLCFMSERLGNSSRAWYDFALSLHFDKRVSYWVSEALKSIVEICFQIDLHCISKCCWRECVLQLYWISMSCGNDFE